MPVLLKIIIFIRLIKKYIPTYIHNQFISYEIRVYERKPNLIRNPRRASVTCA